jgi:hypothetical protein
VRHPFLPLFSQAEQLLNFRAALGEEQLGVNGNPQLPPVGT